MIFGTTRSRCLQDRITPNTSISTLHSKCCALAVDAYKDKHTMNGAAIFLKSERNLHKGVTAMLTKNNLSYRPVK